MILFVVICHCRKSLVGFHFVEILKDRCLWGKDLSITISLQSSTIPLPKVWIKMHYMYDEIFHPFDWKKKSFWLCIFLVKSSCITLFSDTLVLQFPCSNAPSIYKFWRICWLLEGYGNNLILYDLQMFITTCVFHGSRAETWRFSSFLIILWWNLFFCGSSQSPLWYLSSVHKTLKKGTNIIE